MDSDREKLQAVDDARKSIIQQPVKSSISKKSFGWEVKKMEEPSSLFPHVRFVESNNSHSMVAYC